MWSDQKTSEVCQKHDFFKSRQDESNVRMICRLLDIAANSFSAWQKFSMSNHAREDARLFLLILASY
mgnify:CR=1 FL=1